MGQCCLDSINIPKLAKSDDESIILDTTNIGKYPFKFSSNISLTPDNLNKLLNEIFVNHISLIIQSYLDLFEISNLSYSDAIHCYHCHDDLFALPFPHSYFKNLMSGQNKTKYTLKIAIIGDYWSQPDCNITSNLFKNKFESSWDPYVCDDYMLSMSIDHTNKLCIIPFNQPNSVNNNIISCMVSSITMTEFKGKPISHKMRNESQHIKKLMSEQYVGSYVNNLSQIYDIYFIYFNGCKIESFENAKLIYQSIKHNKEYKDKFRCLISTIGNSYHILKSSFKFCKQESMCCFVTHECTNTAVLDLMLCILKEYWFSNVI